MFLITVAVAHSAGGGEEGKTQEFFFLQGFSVVSYFLYGPSISMT